MNELQLSTRLAEGRLGVYTSHYLKTSSPIFGTTLFRNQVTMANTSIGTLSTPVTGIQVPTKPLRTWTPSTSCDAVAPAATENANGPCQQEQSAHSTARKKSTFTSTGKSRGGRDMLFKARRG